MGGIQGLELVLSGSEEQARRRKTIGPKISRDACDNGTQWADGRGPCPNFMKPTGFIDSISCFQVTSSSKRYTACYVHASMLAIWAM